MEELGNPRFAGQAVNNGQVKGYDSMIRDDSMHEATFASLHVPKRLMKIMEKEIGMLEDSIRSVLIRPLSLLSFIMVFED